MEINEFNGLCARYTINPAIALENNTIVELLLSIRDTKDASSRNGYRNNLIQTLETQF